VAEDLRVTDSRYGQTLSLWKCCSCGFRFAHKDELTELTSMYERLIDVEYEESRETRTLQMRWLLDSVLAACPGSRSLLDVGAGMGLLVAEARRRGLSAVGVEPSRFFVHSAASRGLEVLQGVFPHPALTGRRFDLIFLVDVIEHVAEPVRLLRECGSALEGNGVLAVVTPDVSSLAARILGPRWWHFRLAHVGYFDRRSLAHGAGEAGLSIVRHFPARWFFRVRYLAERVAVYCPVAWVNRLALRLAPLRWLYDRTIPVNLHDSMVVLLRRADVRGCR
jgi:2-polyprenyl-3-methyl-5-hydroxy-6-metoxy-1,4-benzoquinol methylase